MMRMSLTDNGDGVVVSVAHRDVNPETLHLDYGQAVELMMILDTYNKNLDHTARFKRFAEVE